MKKILTLLILMVSFFATKAYADKLDFTVTPILEEEQSVTDQTISAKYQAQQTLRFNLQNNSDNTIDINIKTAIPDLDNDGNPIFTDGHTFLDSPSTITLPPNGSQEITINYKAETFKKDFDGEVTNAILFCQGEKNITYLVNVRKNDNKDTENIVIEKSEAVILNNKYFIRILIKNDSNAWLNNVLIDSHIMDQATEQSDTHQFSHIAPNSKIEILIPMSEKFKAGTYLTLNTVQTASRTWNLESQFKLSTEKIDELNGIEAPIHKGEHSKIFYFVSILFFLLVLTIILQFNFIQKHNRI
ncbi:WxL protein host-binding domain-containing protein [Pseudolactococcus reticulitermitis]|uniref:WxL Interacting Protein host binding domain-containing protein n=1 Tax=Pseudolactococcus reticulitermitis TaxID=2025039 RepID=A0A224X9I8_9LACT|nr:DUF3324 domain-containing protein [Lactococcus reticulitermitis]GAX47930.1 hypothetical protein RsY01_1543 [Lactococcus reticulitermitis]